MIKVKSIFIALAFATLVIAQQTPTKTKSSQPTDTDNETSNAPSSAPLLWLSSSNEVEEHANAFTKRNDAVEKDSAKIEQSAENDITREASDSESNQDIERRGPPRGKHGPKHHHAGINDREEQDPRRHQNPQSGEMETWSTESNDEEDSQNFGTSEEMDGESYKTVNQYGETNPWYFEDVSTNSQSFEEYIQKATQTGEDTTDSENIIQLTMGNMVK